MIAALSPDMPRQLGLPYCGQIDTAMAWWLQFNTDPVVIAVLAACAAAVFMTGGPLRARRLLAIGLAALLWLSPLCPASASFLSMRAVHHLLVMLVLAPLAAKAWPTGAIAAWTTRPGAATGWAIAASVSLAVWFAPAVYSAAWASAAVYWALQVAMLGASVMLWRALFTAQIGESGPVQMFSALAITGASMGMIGAVLTFSPRVLLLEHQLPTALLGISPLIDQQAAGLVLWVFGSVPLAILAARTFIRMLHPAAPR